MNRLILKKNETSTLCLFGLLFVLISNYLLYHSFFQINSSSPNLKGMVVGSILNLSLVVPLLFLGWQHKFNLKYFIMLIPAGLILARFIIPIEHLSSFGAVIYGWVLK